MAVVKNAIKAMEATMSPESIARARREAERDIFRIRLSDLRKQMGIKQTDIEAFSQASISKLEKRKDMKVSTLVDYLECLGLGVEIKVFPKKHKKGMPEEITLLKA
jgi:hypothetical protein